MSKRRQTRRSRRGLLLGCILCMAVALGGQGVALAASTARTLVPVGHTVGVKLFSDGVVVVGLAKGERGRTPASACGLQVGDVIDRANGRSVHTSEEFSRLLQTDGPVTLSVDREGVALELTAEPEQGDDGAYRLGAWVRDSMAGIGTVTFYDPATGRFGALGHGIADGDTGRLVPLGHGTILPSTVKAVKKGTAGQPGELRGSFDLGRDLGLLTANTGRGIFGQMAAGPLTKGRAIPVAETHEVRPGPAEILANISGDSVKSYRVEILKTMDSTDGRDLLLRVVDPVLLRETGGIVQGMSGSPIIQNGKLVGAVTHVLLRQPDTGYGILIENMLEAAG